MQGEKFCLMLDLFINYTSEAAYGTRGQEASVVEEGSVMEMTANSRSQCHLPRHG